MNREYMKVHLRRRRALVGDGKVATGLDAEGKKAWKCDFCGGDPQCFAWCPANALGVVEFGGEIPK
ncbi:MAG: hypothetical protein ACM3N7_11075 [Planctomycetaceae bacterium]